MKPIKWKKGDNFEALYIGKMKVAMVFFTSLVAKGTKERWKVVFDLPSLATQLFLTQDQAKRHGEAQITKWFKETE